MPVTENQNAVQNSQPIRESTRIIQKSGRSGAQQFIDNGFGKMKNMDFSRYPFNTDDEYHFYIENYENEVIDLEVFVEVFQIIGENLSSIAGYYEEMATFVPDYD